MEWTAKQRKAELEWGSKGQSISDGRGSARKNYLVKVRAIYTQYIFLLWLWLCHDQACSKPTTDLKRVFGALGDRCYKCLRLEEIDGTKDFHLKQISKCHGGLEGLRQFTCLHVSQILP